jgi:hypothetical protein
MSTFKTYFDNKLASKADDWLTGHNNHDKQYGREDWNGQQVFTSIDDVPTWGTTPQEQFLKTYVGCKLLFEACVIERNGETVILRKKGTAISFNNLSHATEIEVDQQNSEGFVEAELQAMKLIAFTLNGAVAALDIPNINDYLSFQAGSGGWEKV